MEKPARKRVTFKPSSINSGIDILEPPFDIKMEDFITDCSFGIQVTTR